MTSKCLVYSLTGFGLTGETATENIFGETEKKSVYVRHIK